MIRPSLGPGAPSAGTGTGGGEPIATNLGRTISATQVTITSSSGANATVPAATPEAAGVMTAAMVQKLASIASEATKNSADATLLDRSNHAGTQPISTVEGLADLLLSLQTAVEQAGEGFKIKNTRVSLLGDSLTAQNSSPTVGTENYGYICHAQRGSGQRTTFDLGSNFGVGGNTTTQMVPRVPNVIATGDGICVVLGGTNDRGGAAMTDVQTLDNLRTIRDELNAAGVYAILLVPPPRGDAANPGNRLSTLQLGYHLSVRRRLLAEFSIPGKCSVVDTWGTLADPLSTTGDIKAGCTHDGLHFNPTGALLCGRPLATEFVRLLPPVAILPVSNGDLFHATDNPRGLASTNPKMEGTTGSPGTGGSGQLATGYSGTNASGTTGVTRTYSKVTTPTGDWQQCEVGGVAATSASALDLARQLGLHTNMVPGVAYECVGEFEIDAGSSNILSLQLGIVLTDGSGTTTLWDGDRYVIGQTISAEADAGTLRTPSVLATPSMSDARLRLTVYLNTGGAPAATFRFRNLALKPVQ